MKCLNPLRRLLPLVAAALCFSTALFAQQQTVTISFSDTPIKTVLREVTRQTGYNFVYSDALTELDRRIDIELSSSGASIDNILGRVFDGTDIRYTISDKQVALLNNSIERGSLDRQQPTRRTAPPANAGLVSGVVRHSETGERLVGVVVNVRGTEIYAVSDATGSYSIMSPPDGVLSFSYLGMLPREVDVSSRTNIQVTLQPDQISMRGIIVTGYQTLSTERATGSFGSVTAADMEDKMQPNLASVLEGQVAGLSVDQYGQISIRGVATLNAETSPLIVIDGFPVDASVDDTFFRYKDGLLENINVDNIESVTVLKDGVAASIYGARAANGVIVITTKKGRIGEAQFSYRGTFGFAAKPDLDNLNKTGVNDYIDAEIDLFNLNPNSVNLNGTTVVSRVSYLMKQAQQGIITQADAEIDLLRKNDFLGDLEEHVYRPQLSHQHNLTVNGGSERNTYNFAVNYLDVRQNFKNADNDRLTFDIKDEWKFSDFLTVSAAVNLAYSNLRSPTINPDRNYTAGDATGSQRLFNFAMSSYFNPYQSLIDEDGNVADIWGISPNKLAGYADRDGMKNAGYDFLNDISREMVSTKDFQARVTGQARLNIVDGLNFEVGGSWQRGSYKFERLRAKEAFAVREAYNDSQSKVNPANHHLPDGAIVDENRNSTESWTIRSQFNFNRNFSGTKHRLSALVGNEIRKNTQDRITMATRGGYNENAGTFIPLNILDYNSTVGSNDMLYGRRISFVTGSYGYRDVRFVSWYGNASYEYDDRFILSGSVRLDLTNFFGTDPKYRYKPLWSVGGTWKLSNEDFFDVDFVDRLYLRGSYGLNGNIKLDQGPFLILAAGAYNTTSQGMSYTISSPPNNQLRWEKTMSANFGVDATLFGNKLDVTLDVYRKLSTDVLANETVDQTIGYMAVMRNAGTIRNAGVELSVSADAVDTGDFRWSLVGNFAYNDNKVKEFNEMKAAVGNYLNSTGVNVAGYPVKGLWSLHFAPPDGTTGAARIINAAGESILSTQARPEDAYFYGSTIPKFELSLTNRFAYRNWELSFMIISKLGHYYLKDSFHSQNIQNKHVADRWREPGDEKWAKYPAMSLTSYDYWYAPFIDTNINSAGFARVRDITLTYSFDRSLVERIGLSSAKVYFQARNLITLRAKGMDIDPESGIPYNGGYNSSTDFAFSSLPLPRELYLGVQITF